MKAPKLFLSLAAVAYALYAAAGSLVILHTNDTHSNIDPDQNGAGGILQRKAIIDSVRKVEKNVILIDAGDIVQGTLYFKYFGGDVEYPLMNMMGYDIQIPGNHEFDNGITELAKHYKTLKADKLSANYDFSGTPLQGIFQPYVIKKVDGKKIGFIGLNVDPESLIAKKNIEGIGFSNIIQTANRTAEFLKKQKKCDLVVAVTHIGYTPDSPGKDTDVDLAHASKDIDIIIGGHSHTIVSPGTDGKYPSIVENANGKNVLITQTGKYGKNLGYIKIDIDNLKDTKDFEYKLIPVTDRFPESELDKKMEQFISHYREKVDSVNARQIAVSAFDLDSDNPNSGYANWAADYARFTGQHTLDSIHSSDSSSHLPSKIDIGLMNVGGIRKSMPAGPVTEGQILSTFPFANKMVIMTLSGQDFIDAMKVAAKRGGEGVSENIRVVVNPDNSIYKVVVDDHEIEPEKEYIVSTIDYLAEGNDDMTSLANGKVIWTDDKEMAAPVMRYVEHFTKLGLPIAPDMNGRFVKKISFPSQENDSAK